jgi:hypothetical protein
MNRFLQTCALTVGILFPLMPCPALLGQVDQRPAIAAPGSVIWGTLGDVPSASDVPDDWEPVYGSKAGAAGAELPGEPPHSPQPFRFGEPLATTSWLNRPFYAGWWWGGLIGGSLIDGRVESEGGMIGGYRLGWDRDCHWGAEARFGFSYPTIHNEGESPASRSSSQQYWDVDLLYYPWGDSRWRPYFLAGCGWANFDFVDDQQQGVYETLWSFPLGGGVKYLYRPWLALRLSVVDNLTLGAHELSTMHNLAISGDVEVHFGGPRWSYFPYHGSIHLW